MKNSFVKTKKAITSLFTFMAAFMMNYSIVFAVPYNMDRLSQKFIYTMVTIFFYIGIILLPFSVGSLVLSIKNEDAESKSRAIMLIAVSIVLLTMNFIWKLLGIWGYTMIERA